jgi:hypothetical protein
MYVVIANLIILFLGSEYWVRGGLLKLSPEAKTAGVATGSKCGFFFFFLQRQLSRLKTKLTIFE